MNINFDPLKRWLKKANTPKHTRVQGERERRRRLRQVAHGQLSGGASNPTFTAAADATALYEILQKEDAA